MENMTRKEEVLLILMEECGEVAQRASKCIRFGGTSNDAELEKEIGDLMCMIDLLVEDGYIDWGIVHSQAEKKRKKLEIYSNILK